MTESTCKRRRSPVLLAVLGPLALGCARPGPGAGGFEMPPTPVEVATVTRATVADRLHAVGTVAANEAVTIVTEVEENVRALPFREGDAVDKGAVLVEMDDAELRAEVARAEALVAQSRSRHERIQRVVAEGVRPPQDLDDSTAALKVAEANLELARVRLAKTRIVAPFSGIVGARLVSPGAWLRLGDPVVELLDTSEVKIGFAAPERHLAALRPGVEVAVTTPAFAGELRTGRVDLVEPSVDPGTRNVRVRARVPNPDGKLRPGMSADVTVTLAERPGALTVPVGAVFAEGDRFYVYVVKDDSTVARAAVGLGTRGAADIEITSGLAEGQKVVRSGHQKLFEGARVAPVEPAAEAAATGSGGEAGAGLAAAAGPAPAPGSGR